jgi:ribosome-associated translation inhibitor RaiA
MKAPVEITYRDVTKSHAVDQLIQKQAAKLEKFCDYISGCRVAVEKPKQHQTSGNPFRVRIHITVPPSHELVAVREPRDSAPRTRLQSVIISAFKAARRQLQELVERQRGE